MMMSPLTSCLSLRPGIMNNQSYVLKIMRFRQDRGKRGGGVCIYTKTSDSLNFRDIDCEQLKSKEVEQIWCGVDTGKESILLGCIYRPRIMRNSSNEICSNEIHKKSDGEIFKSIKSAYNLIIKGSFNGMGILITLNYPGMNHLNRLYY